MCRYHGARKASAAVYVGDWVLLCTGCGNAVRQHALRILDETGQYNGYLPLG